MSPRRSSTGAAAIDTVADGIPLLARQIAEFADVPKDRAKAARRRARDASRRELGDVFFDPAVMSVGMLQERIRNRVVGETDDLLGALLCLEAAKLLQAHGAEHGQTLDALVAGFLYVDRHRRAVEAGALRAAGLESAADRKARAVLPADVVATFWKHAANPGLSDRRLAEIVNGKHRISLSANGELSSDGARKKLQKLFDERKRERNASSPPNLALKIPPVRN